MMAFFIKENIEYYRIAAVAINALFVLGVVLLTGLYYDRRTTVYALFTASVMSAVFAVSRIYLSNNLVTLFMVYSVYFLEKAIKNGKIWHLLFVITFLLGFNTYINWAVIIPAIIAIIVIRYYEGVIDKKRMSGLISFVIILSFTAYTYLLTFSHMPEYVLNMILYPESGKTGIFQKLGMLYMSGGSNTAFYLLNWPYFSYIETILVIVSVFFMFKEIQNPANRIMMSLYGIFLISVIFIEVPHIFRINHLLFPSIILIAYSLREIEKANRIAAVPVMAVILVFNAVYISNYFKNWEGQAIRDDMNKRISHDLEKKYPADIIYTGSFDPDNYRSVTLRLSSTYIKNNDADYIAAKINYFWYYELLKDANINDYTIESMDAYKSTLTGNNAMFPSVVIAARRNSKFGKKIAQYEKSIAALKAEKKNMKAEKWIDSLWKSISDNKADMLFNTFIKDMLGNAYIDFNRLDLAAKTFTNLEIKAYQSPDFYLKAARCFYIIGETEKYNYYIRQFKEKSDSLSGL
jgi:hypothetical protein